MLKQEVSRYQVNRYAQIHKQIATQPVFIYSDSHCSLNSNFESAILTALRKARLWLPPQLFPKCNSGCANRMTL